MSSIVSANVTFQGSVTTQALYGVSNTATTAYVPQDFSSSALNIPAYVVSNTATSANTITYSSTGPFTGEGSLYGGGGSGYAIKTLATALDYNFAIADYTFEAWIYITDLTTDNAIFNNGTVSFTISTPGKVRVQMVGMAGAPYLSSSTTIFTNGWYHVAATFTSATVRLFTNGTLTDTFTSVTGTPTYTSPQQMYIMANNALALQFKGYLSNLRIIRGTALYTAAFTPPTGPLQPLQGLTYGTVLLLRNAPAPGRVLTQKFSGQNSVNSLGLSSVLAFPPAAMTGYSTSLNAGYGQGTYVASASSEYSTYYAWQALDKNTGTAWTSGLNYTIATPYSGSVVTTDTTGTSYKGEWLQIQKPIALVTSTYTLNVSYAMSIWYVLGSRDGVNWSLVDSRNTAVGNGAIVTYTVSGSQAFTYFRLVINQVTGTTSASITEWTLNGSIEGPNVSADGRLGVGVSAPVQALEVAGSAIVTGTVSAGNPLMFRNRIVNGNFNIWQRGTTFTSSINTSIYTVDRWCTPSNGVASTVIQSTNVPFRAGFQYSVSIAQAVGGSPALLEQRIEQLNTYDLYQGTPITVSFWAIQTVGTPGLLNVEPLIPTGVNTGYSGMSDACNPLRQSFQLASSWQYFTTVFTIASTSVATNGLVVQLWQPSAVNPATILITGVQLEKGTVATPFEFRPYGTELALCQRYYHRTSGLNLEAVAMSIISATAAQGLYRLPVTMRAAPTFGSSGTFTLDWSTVNYNSVTSIALGGSQTGVDTAMILASGVGTGTAGSVTVGQVRFLISTTTGCYIEFIAEL
jgi:hypothetical protein